ncbi:Polygalacturonase 3 [Mycena kentingensis (nom. inval.)]|nr:Polygalacturonase 3 [Mycena kentingensis (nom. inval.)]
MFPTEIWLNVADHLPPAFVANMYSVNSQWYNISMDVRYRSVSFAFLNRAMVRDLTRLRDPAVARRVRTLHIHPYFVKEVLERTHSAPHPHPHSLRGKFKLGGLFHNHGKRLARICRTPASLLLSPDELVRTMADTISGLPYVTHFDIAWNGLHTIHDLPVPFLVAGFRPSVLTLKLEVSLEKTVELLAHTERLTGLEELDLFIRLDHLYAPETYEEILVEHLAPAINRLHATLQKLSLRLCEPLDIAPLFDSLRLLSCLDSLNIAIPMARPHLGHPSGLGNFLERHRSSLRHLSLRASELSGDGIIPPDDPVSEWVNDALSFVVGPTKLKTLDMGLALFPVEAAALCLGRFARSLTSLTLTGRHLPYDRVDELLSAVRRTGRRLQSLRLGTVTLSPDLVDLVAEKLPGLAQLDLIVRDVVASEGDFPLWNDGEQDDGQIGGFFIEMERRRYREWALTRLALSKSAFPFDQLQYAADYRELFEECIPSLRAIPA